MVLVVCCGAAFGMRRRDDRHKAFCRLGGVIVIPAGRSPRIDPSFATTSRRGSTLRFGTCVRRLQCTSTDAVALFASVSLLTISKERPLDRLVFNYLNADDGQA